MTTLQFCRSHCLSAPLLLQLERLMKQHDAGSADELLEMAEKQASRAWPASSLLALRWVLLAAVQRAGSRPNVNCVAEGAALHMRFLLEGR